MRQNMVTSGQRFTDIDALACAVAYGELLVLEGQEAQVVLPGIFNTSIPQTVKDWGAQYVTAPSFSGADCTVVDVSDPAHMAVCAQENTIVEVFDHHLGFEAYWQERLGEKSHIEFIGACATLIWEEYQKRQQAKNVSALSGRLLSVAILSNTLNFGAAITDERDIQAFDELQLLHPLSSEWRAQYFLDQEQEIHENVAQAVTRDTKVITSLSAFPALTMGQLELWEGSGFLEKNQDTIKQALESFQGDFWLMSIPSIKEKRNYLYTENEALKDALSKALDMTFSGHFGTTPKLWLRKEILKALHSF